MEGKACGRYFPEFWSMRCCIGYTGKSGSRVTLRPTQHGREYCNDTNICKHSYSSKMAKISSQENSTKSRCKSVVVSLDTTRVC